MQGDATVLPFEDETFDAVTSNYVYHNIPSRDRQSFVQKLKDMGYSEVKLVDTTNGMFMSKWESTWMGLSGSSILMGRK